MVKTRWLFLGFLLIIGWISFGFKSNSIIPGQPVSGPGEASYVVDSVIMENFAKKADGYWLFRPEKVDIPLEKLIVFNHGYGAINPMIYGAWIKHLVRKGNIVVFPRYQKDLLSPRPKKFTQNAATGINAAIQLLRSRNMLTNDDFHLSLVGHSYGGVVSAGLANDYKTYEIPKPQVVMLCSPGTGPLKGGLLENYKGIDADTKFLVMTSVNDRTVGEEFGFHVFKTSPQIEASNLIRQFPDNHDGLHITAGHNECYALDSQFDSGLRNVSTKRALRIGKIDPIDYYGYWKLFDALRECSIAVEHCEIALGGGEKQSFLGEWTDKVAIRPLTIYTEINEIP